LADYRVNLDIFAGPVDLLLYLVRKEEVDIYDIPISRITDQYLHYVEMLKQFDIDLAGDFLVMAATLMEIKSAMLLPKAEPEAEAADDAADPRSELIRQLLEYKKFKDAANLLDAAAEQQKERFGRPTNLIDRLEPEAEPEVDMDQVSIWDLLEAFDTVCKSIGTTVYTGHIKDDTPIDLYQIEILHRLQSEGPMTFERIFESRPNRLVMVGLFLAMLELIRDKLAWAEQSDSSPQQIYVRALTDEPAEQAVQNAILAVHELQADAPSEPAESEQPPIPIAEVPTKPEQPQVDEEEDVAAEIDNSAADEASPLPIPIAELPAKPKPASHPQPSHDLDEAVEDDLAFDRLPESP
jgi:segregation and condensation protein A